MKKNSNIKSFKWNLLIVVCAFLTYTKEAKAIDDFKSGKRNCDTPTSIEKITYLQKECIYRNGFTAKTPNSVLDCDGAIIDGGSSKSPYGIEITASNITIKNCRIKNFKKNGIIIHSEVSKKNLKPDEDNIRYKYSPKNIRILNSFVSENLSDGIFIGNHVEQVTIIDNEIFLNRGPGVYLEYSSRKNILVGNSIHNNGIPTIKEKKKWPNAREAIAIDASYENKIKNNKIYSNGAGGIFLYKNCGEKNGPIRSAPANRNIISKNTFIDTEIGIWIAQRQSIDLSAYRCSSKYYGDGKYVLDESKENLVKENYFSNVNLPIKVEDDGNVIIGNIMNSAREACIMIGTEFRNKYLKKPVTNTIVEENLCEIQNNENIGFPVKYNSKETKNFNNKILYKDQP